MTKKNVEIYIPITEFGGLDLNWLFVVCAQIAQYREQFKPLGGMPHLSLSFAKEVLGMIEGYKNEYLLGYIETLELGES